MKQESQDMAGLSLSINMNFVEDVLLCLETMFPHREGTKGVWH